MDARLAVCHAILEELLTDSTELSGGEKSRDILPVVLHLSFYRRQNIPRIGNYVDLVENLYDGDDFRSHFRITRGTFEQIELFLGNIPGKHQQQEAAGRPVVALRKQLLLFLWYLGTQETFISLADRFGVALSTAHAVVERITDAFCSVHGSIIVWPHSAAEVFGVSEGFQQLCGVGGIIGAIDGSHIRIRPPADDEQSYFNRKKFHSIILQGVSIASYLFTNVYVGWPGSTHDSCVLRNSPLCQSAEGNYQNFFRGNTFLVADPAYAARRWLAPTLKRLPGQTPQQRKYSTTIAKARVVIEQSFGILKGRWRRLHNLNLQVDIERVPCTVLAACVLHNICMMEDEEFEDLLTGPGEDDDDDDDDDGDDDGDVEPLLPHQAGGTALVGHLMTVIDALP